MKLINFTDSDGSQVWINPEKVCRILIRKENQCSVYTEDGGMTWLSMPAKMAIDILQEKAIILGTSETKKPAKKGTKK
jgi:hypothetical protein